MINTSLEKVFMAMYFGRTIFAADKIFIGLFSCFRLRQKESQMEIVSDHLCHFQSKSLSAFRRNVRNQICFSGSIWMVLLFFVEVSILIFFGYNDFHMVQFTALIRKKVEIYSQDLTQSNFGASDKGSHPLPNRMFFYTLCKRHDC